MSVFNDQRLDKFPVAKFQGTNLAMSDSLTGDSKLTYGAYGLLKCIRSTAPAFTTATQYTFSLIDEDTATVYTSGNMTHNSTEYVNLALDDYVPLCGEYLGRWTVIGTAQTLAADLFRTIIFLDFNR